MTLRAAYEAFLSSPSVEALNGDDSALHYIPTVTSLTSPQSIISHLQKQAKQLKTPELKILSVIEDSNTLAVEIATTFEFLSSGGAYLPGLDDNFLADRKAYVPIVCTP
jgi:hypothetical protein